MRFSPTQHPNRIAIIELSSTACKLLIGDPKELTKGFVWGRPAFFNRSVLTNAWFDLHVRGQGVKALIDGKLKPALNTLFHEIESHKVDKLICVATSGYRLGIEEQALLRAVEKELPCRVETLTSTREREATIEAYLWSRNRGDRPCLFIDQGGGSTELSLLNAKGEILQSEVLQWGTLKALQGLLDGEGDLEQWLCAPIEINVTKNIPIGTEVVASGSAITQCLELRSNQHQHERVLASSLLEQKCFQIKKTFITEILHCK